MMDYLKDNAGAAQAILSAIYVIATIGMFISMLHANKLVRANIQAIITAEIERQKPIVYFDLAPDRVFVTAIVKNVGLSAAYDVSIEITPKIIVKDRMRDGEISLASRTVAFLAPQQEIEEFVEGFPQFIKLYPELKFNGKIKYRNSANKWYEDEIHVDLSIHKERQYLGVKDIAEELGNLNDTLRDVARILQKP